MRGNLIFVLVTWFPGLVPELGIGLWGPTLSAWLRCISCRVNRLEVWREFCMVFTNCADFSMLEVDGSTLDIVSLSVLFGALACQPHKLQWLV